jgi:hypothetical protein
MNESVQLVATSPRHEDDVVAEPLAFETFFETEAPTLFRRLCAVTGNAAEAEEIMQDAFLALWERWERARAPKERGFFQLPRSTGEHFCYAHESNVVPMHGPHDIVVTGWFGGGVDLVDFTDPSRPREIASWVSSGADGAHSFAYAGYWYDGHVYAGNTALESLDDPMTQRGFDVFAVDDPVLAMAIDLPHMNAQTQEPLPRP